AGVDSFKVEGRTKSVYYVSLITRAYRKALDDLLSGNPFNPELFLDIFATANKGFTAGFLNGNPGHSAQKYDGTMAENQHYRFAGIVRDYDKDRKLMKFEPKNKICQGTKLEIVSPQKTVPFTVEQIYNDRMKEIDMVSGGVETVWITCPDKPDEFSLARLKITD
ncbi:hypothetical protein B6I21_07895, partial [candidate division KSB1 bacterium 4572_119]